MKPSTTYSSAFLSVCGGYHKYGVVLMVSLPGYNISKRKEMIERQRQRDMKECHLQEIPNDMEYGVIDTLNRKIYLERNDQESVRKMSLKECHLQERLTSIPMSYEVIDVQAIVDRNNSLRLYNLIGNWYYPLQHPLLSTALRVRIYCPRLQSN